jgi:hypothetical protein
VHKTTIQQSTDALQIVNTSINQEHPIKVAPVELDTAGMDSSAEAFARITKFGLILLVKI